jgi:hypothetical protein
MPAGLPPLHLSLARPSPAPPSEPGGPTSIRQLTTTLYTYSYATALMHEDAAVRSDRVYKNITGAYWGVAKW